MFLRIVPYLDSVVAMHSDEKEKSVACVKRLEKECAEATVEMIQVTAKLELTLV